MRWEGARGERALERWRSTACEAARQAWAQLAAVITDRRTTADVAGRLATTSCPAALQEDATTPLRAPRRPRRVDEGDEVVLVVGPEAGSARRRSRRWRLRRTSWATRCCALPRRVRRPHWCCHSGRTAGDAPFSASARRDRPGVALEGYQHLPSVREVPRPQAARLWPTPPTRPHRLPSRRARRAGHGRPAGPPGRAAAADRGGLASDIHVRGNEITITGDPADNATVGPALRGAARADRAGRALTADAVTRSLGMLAAARPPSGRPRC